MNRTIQANEKEMVALFADFRGFSHMFDVLPAQKVYKFTNRYYQTASEIIERYKGVLDNIVGDGLVAIWGKDQVIPKSAFFAVRSALEMRMALLRQNIQFVRPNRPASMLQCPGKGYRCRTNNLVL